MDALFAAALLAALVFALAVSFAAPGRRARWRALLVGSVLIGWIALGFTIAQIVQRTAGTLGTSLSRAVRQPELFWPAARQAGTLFASLVGPALLVTALGWMALRATRPGRRRPPGPLSPPRELR